MTMQPSDLASSRSANPFSVSRSSAVGSQTFSSPCTSQAVTPQPSQPISQPWGFPQVSCDLPSGAGPVVSTYDVSVHPSAPERYGTGDDISAKGIVTKGMPVLDIGPQAATLGDPAGDATALVDWYRQIISGLSEENTQLSTQLHEAKNEIQRLKSNNPQHPFDGQHVVGTISWKESGFPAAVHQPLSFPAQPHQTLAECAHGAFGSGAASASCDMQHCEPLGHSPNMSKHPVLAGPGRTGSDGTRSPCSDEGSGTGARPCFWSPAEHRRFLEALTMFKGSKAPPQDSEQGKVSVGLGPGIAELVAGHVRTRTVNQVRSHAQKYFIKESKKAKAKAEGKMRQPEER